MRGILFIYILHFSGIVYSQVGIGTTTPYASLEIVASNQVAPASTDGILIPRIDDFAAVSPNASQDGMLVYVTGNGTPSKGFYFWNDANSQWSPFLLETNSDFYKEGTVSAAANTTDNIYRMGNMAIGKNTATAYLDIEHSLDTGNGLLITSTGTGYGIKYHIYNDIATSATGSQYSIYNNFNGNNTYAKHGVYNNFTDIGGTKYGVYNNFTGTQTGSIYGNYTRINNTSSQTKYGAYNYLLGFTGGASGTRNQLTPSSSSTGTVYGSYNMVSSSGSGLHYGVYASAYGDGNRAVFGTNTHSSGYAAYFQGRGYFNGDVGIGELNPSYKLDVSGVSISNYVAQIENLGNSTEADGLKIKLGYASPSSTNYYIGFFDSTESVNGRIQGTGVGVSYQTLSDKRLKTNIESIDGALEIISRIEPKSYEFKELRGKKEMGFLAQDLQLVYPQAVSGDPDSDVAKNPMMVDYSRLTPLLTAGVKELNSKLELLLKENKELRQKLKKYEELERRVSVLEKK